MFVNSDFKLGIEPTPCCSEVRVAAKINHQKEKVKKSYLHFELILVDLEQEV